jgi:hypothetical protein
MLPLPGLIKNTNCTIFQQDTGIQYRSYVSMQHENPTLNLQAAEVALHGPWPWLIGWLASYCSRVQKAQALSSPIIKTAGTRRKVLACLFISRTVRQRIQEMDGPSILVVSAPARFSSLTLLVSAGRQRSMAIIHRSGSIIPLDAKHLNWRSRYSNNPASHSPQGALTGGNVARTWSGRTDCI